MEDFDYDPRMLVPALMEGEPGYRAELDARLSRVERASRHHKNFTFTVAKGSFLDTTHTQQKMFNLQMFRMQLLDPWSLWEAFDVPNIGPVPPDPIPQRIKLAQLMGLMPPPPGMMPPGAGGAPGGPPGGGPGRPPSGKEPPQIVQRTDSNGVPRQAVSESGR